MSAQPQTLAEIRRAGLEALARELGPVGMVRFLQQFEAGRGDYTADRLRWLEHETAREVAIEIERQREE